MTTQPLMTTDPAPGAILVQVQVVGRRTVVSVTGEIDMANAPDLQREVEAAIAAGALELWIDMTATTFMDSSGLNVLLWTERRVRELGRRLAVICPGGVVRRVFEVSGVDRRLPIFEHRAAAHLAT